MAHVFFQQWVTSEAQRASLGCRGLQGRLPRTHTQICESAARFRCALWGETGVQPERFQFWDSVKSSSRSLFPLSDAVLAGWRLWGRCPPVFGQNHCCNSCDDWHTYDCWLENALASAEVSVQTRYCTDFGCNGLFILSHCCLSVLCSLQLPIYFILLVPFIVVKFPAD